MSNQDIDIGDVETSRRDQLPMLADASLAATLARTELDQAVATARAMPRRLQACADNLLTIATLDEETAAECIYGVPRDGKTIRGPSIRFAEMIFSTWGNCRIGSRLVHIDRIEKYVETEAMFIDLQTNASTTARDTRPIAYGGKSKRAGQIYSDDMIMTTIKASGAIAKRNAILGGVPKAIWRRSYNAVEAVIRGDAKTLAERRDLALKKFAASGVSAEQVFARLGVEGVEDLALDKLLDLTAIRNAIKSGDVTIDSEFPALRKPGDESKPKTLDDRLEALANGGDKDFRGAGGSNGAPATDGRSGSPSGEAGAGKVGDSLPTDPVPAGEPADARAVTFGQTDVTAEKSRHGAVMGQQSASGADIVAAILADLVKTGDAKAAQGERALGFWLDQDLTADESALITPAQTKAWQKIARAAKGGDGK